MIKIKNYIADWIWKMHFLKFFYNLKKISNIDTYIPFL